MRWKMKPWVLAGMLLVVGAVNVEHQAVPGMLQQELVWRSVKIDTVDIAHILDVEVWKFELPPLPENSTLGVEIAIWKKGKRDKAILTESMSGRKGDAIQVLFAVRSPDSTLEGAAQLQLYLRVTAGNSAAQKRESIRNPFQQVNKATGITRRAPPELVGQKAEMLLGMRADDIVTGELDRNDVAMVIRVQTTREK